jgi:REP element-mobilizing transposase RayT
MSDTWNRPPPPGFQGFHPDKPIHIYIRGLPHFRQDGATYFVTFRLADSLPQSKLRELRTIKQQWERNHQPPYSHTALRALSRETMRRAERWLDAGYGACLLKDKHCAAHVVGAIHHFEGERCDLGCYAVMPNHVHVVMRPLEPEEHPLESILQSWKRHTSYEINRHVGRRGTLWQEESFDRIIRDEEQLYRAIQYIGRNPTFAGLRDGEFVLWVNPEWEKLGWGFEP